MKRDFFKQCFSNYVFFDGGMGTMLQQHGILSPGEKPERKNLTHPETVEQIHLSYLNAGSDFITANTFGANPLKYPDAGDLTTVIAAGVANARSAIAKSGKQAYAAMDVGPLGKLLRPFGDLSFDDAVDCFTQSIRAGVAAGADLILIETMNDAQETRAAVLAAKQVCDLPVVVTNTYSAHGKLMTGSDAAVMASLLSALGVDALGVNCGEGPQALLPTIQKLLSYAPVPVLTSPNAGLPVTRDGQTAYDLGPQDFARQMCAIADSGASLLGGCCGTTPQYIAATAALLSGKTPSPAKHNLPCTLCSRTQVLFPSSDAPIAVGALDASTYADPEDLLDAAYEQQDAGAQALLLRLGDLSPQQVEAQLEALSASLDMPLCFNAKDSAAKSALRYYCGCALLLNADTAQERSLAAKYGAQVLRQAGEINIR